jgi:hypothetical protein
MPSPDITPYFDVTLYDKTPAQLYADAIDYARIALPEYEPVVGGVEDTIHQAQAWMTSELIGSINRMTPGLLESLLSLLGIDRLSGTQPTATVQITVLDTTGYIIPAGTRFGWTDISDPLNQILYTFDTVEDLEINPGVNVGQVGIEGVLSVQYPLLEDGQLLRLITPVSSILSTQLIGDLAIGADPESDSQYFSRAVALLNSFSDSIVLEQQFEKYVLSHYPSISRCKAYSRVNPINDDLSDPPENGYVTLYVSGAVGASLSPSAVLEMEEALEFRAVAGLIVNVEPPHLVSVPVSTTVKIKSGYLAATVQAAVTKALNEYVHPDFWGWGPTIYYNEIISLIDHVPGVERVVSLTLAGVADDYDFVKYGSLPTGTHSVSVT